MITGCQRQLIDCSNFQLHLQQTVCAVLYNTNISFLYSKQT